MSPEKKQSPASYVTNGVFCSFLHRPLSTVSPPPIPSPKISATHFRHQNPQFPLLRQSPPPTTTNSIGLFFTTSTKPSIFTPIARPIKPISASSSSTTATLITEPKKPQLQGAKIVPLTLSIAIGLLIRFAVPKPVEVTPQAWQLLSIFVSTIAGLVLSPLPVGAWALSGE